MSTPEPPVLDDEPERVRRLLAELSLPGLVDIHTHFMPTSVLDKVWAYFDEAGPLVGRTWPIAYRHTDEERVARLGAFGVQHFTSLLYAHKPGMAEWLNGWAADFAAATPGCLSSATFYPEPGAAAYVSDAIEGGARVFKAHVQVGDYDPTDPLLDPVWGVLEDARTPVVIHVGNGPVPGRFTGPGRTAALLRRHPRLVLIVAHLGSPDYEDFLDLAERHDGVHLDTTMSFTDFTEATAPFPERARPRLLAMGERVLFGSDFPNIPYSYLHALEAVIRLGLGETWTRGVLHDNAARLFGLGERQD